MSLKGASIVHCSCADEWNVVEWQQCGAAETVDSPSPDYHIVESLQFREPDSPTHIQALLFGCG